MIYYFYSKADPKQEPINKVIAISRMSAAKYFAARKRLLLKPFLTIYGVSK